MPEIGETKKGSEIGKNSVHKFIWVACLDCGKERWVALRNGQYRNLRCVSCANRKHEHPSGAKHPNWKGGKIKSVCQNCGEEFLMKPAAIKRGDGKFCSHSCCVIYQRKTGQLARFPNKGESSLIKLFKEDNLPFH